nr:NusG domain II-containing protein [Lachnospiraceae bacterium]
MNERKSFLKKHITGITIGIVFGLALVIYLLSMLFTGDTGYVIVLVDGQEQGIYSLHEDREIRIETDRGDNLLVIGSGQAYIKEADCDNQVCVHTQPIKATGGQIICLPHRVVVRLKSKEKSEIDAVTN